MLENIQSLLIVLMVGEIVSALLELVLNRAAQSFGIDMSDRPFIFAISQLSLLSLTVGDLYSAVVFWFLAVLVGSCLKFFVHR